MTEKTQTEAAEVADTELDDVVGGAAPGSTLGLGAGDDPFGVKSKPKVSKNLGLGAGNDPFGE